MKTTTKTALKHRLRSLLLAAILSNVVLGTWSAWTLTGRYTQSMHTRDDVDNVSERPVAIVFGAGYWPSGALSAILQDRLDAAIDLYRAGRVQKLLFSGDNRFVDYNEPAKMLEYALAQGIPREDIVLDYAGRRTYDTCYRARDIFQVRDVVLVTQRFHLPRALNTCRALGMNAEGLIADQQAYPRRNLIWYWIREVPATWRSWLDVYVLHTVPVLGEPLPIFQETG